MLFDPHPFLALLAKWLRDTALLMGEKARALPAAEVAFRDEISLENYQRVVEIAGERWLSDEQNCWIIRGLRSLPILKGKSMCFYPKDWSVMPSRCWAPTPAIPWSSR
jgi:hypothetical protein